MRALILAGLVAAAPAIAETPAAAGKAQQAPPQSVWRPLADGEVEHLQSGLRCPVTLDDFRRTGITTYDGFGLDVSCGYNSRTVVLTAYLTRGVGADAGFAQAKSDLLQAQEARHPQLVSDGGATLGGLQWLRAEYAIDDDTRTDVWMTDLHGWALEYRATYPARDAAAMSAGLAKLTELVQASAGAHLALCAKSQPPARPGKLMKSKPADDLMSALLGGAAAAGVAEAKATASVPITFCVEDPAPSKGAGLLAWRGVTPDGEDARVDRLTAMTMGPPPALETELDETGSVIAAELHGGKAERWTATVSDGKQVSIFANYERRPAAKVLAPLMLQILDGKARPIGGYSIDGKTITVNTP
jgi:hypothetical protein